MAESAEITVDALIDRYAVLLLDGFGVLVHGSGALPGARELIDELNRIAKPYYILTNDASRLPASRARRYRELGLAIDPNRIITSGSLLPGYFASHRLSGARCAVLGPDDSLRYVEEAGGVIVSPSEGFDVLVIGDQSGFSFLETVDKALTGLFDQVDGDRDVRLVVPNPDLIYPAGDERFGIASGSVALMFEAALALRYPDRPDLRFVRLGKPHTAIFEEALRRSGTRDMVMIGDQLETDIQGANAFGLDSVLMATGVTRSTAPRVPDVPRPTYHMRSLVSPRLRRADG